MDGTCVRMTRSMLLGRVSTRWGFVGGWMSEWVNDTCLRMTRSMLLRRVFGGILWLCGWMNEWVGG